MSISVALCTYNGQEYITAQLQSIAEQSLPPSEIVICDDQSTDDTLVKIAEFQKHSPIPVHVFRNAARLGVAKNFAACLRKCTGEYIALSDQDDVWYKDKLQQMVGMLEERPELAVIFSNLNLVTETLVPKDQTQWEYVGFGAKERKDWQEGRELQVLYRAGNVVTGCATILRASVKERFAEAVYGEYFGKKLHDHVLALLSAAEGSIGFLNQSLGAYRQHAAQVVGTTKQDSRFQNLYAGQQELGEVLESYRKDREGFRKLEVPSARLVYLDRRIQHYSNRMAYAQKRVLRIWQIGKEYAKGNYRYSSGFLSALKDLIR